MRKYSGWFAVSRAMFEHPLVGIRGEIYPRYVAWQDLIAMANFKPPRRGQLTASLRFLARRWRWSVKAVRCFLKALENEGMIQRSIGAHLRGTPNYL